MSFVGGVSGTPALLSTTLSDEAASALAARGASALASGVERIAGVDWGTRAMPIPVQPGASAHAVLQRALDEA
ncbi:MAG: hypothetical protein ACK54X_01290, partial [Burkholderiales bacterium]